MKMRLAVILLLLALEYPALGGKVVHDPGWVEEALRRHNEFRRGFGSPPLALNPVLCDSSLNFARELASRDVQEELEHSDWGFGENIYRARGNITIYGSTPVDRWYDEIENYMKSKEKDNSVEEDEELDDAAIGSFTQVIWKATTDMCISYAASEPDEDGSDGALYIVAHYLPRGNTEEEELNVTPLMSSPYFYKNSKSAPQRRHLSDPIGSDGLVQGGDSKHGERSCWDETWSADRDAKEVTTPAQFIAEALNVTNELRLYHHVLPVEEVYRNCTLCKSAQGLADALVANEAGYSWMNEEVSDCGLMLYNSSQLLSAEKLINAWYAEGDTYEYYHQRTSTGVHSGDFVRLLWKGTEQFCVAYAKKENASEYIYVGVVYQDEKPNYDKREARKENVLSGAPGSASKFLALSLATLIAATQFS